MSKKRTDRKSASGAKRQKSGAAVSRAVRVLLPKEAFESYEEVARDEHISIAQVVARVAIEFADIEKKASKQRRAILEGSREEVLNALRRDRRRAEAYSLEPGEAMADPAARLYADIFSQLFGFDRASVTEFFQNSKENSSMVNDRGFLFVETNKPGFRVYECYAEKEGQASFKARDWPIEIGCRSGRASLLFTGKQFQNLPVLVEFEPGHRFGIPPKAECTLRLRGRSTISLKSYDSAAEASGASVDFERISGLLLDLAKRDALEHIPGSDKKGLIIRLEDRA
jgi:hypothetical protein